MSILQTTQPIRDILFEVIGEIKVKTFFSYYGLFKNDLMFGLYKNNRFYLRVSPNALEQSEWISSLTRLDDPNMGIHYKHFYYIPEPLLSQPVKYVHLIQETLAEMSVIKQESYLSRRKLIRSLPNLNIHIERLLRRLDIHSIDDLYAVGEIQIFVEMIKRGIDADQQLLFKLYGAIHHQYIYTMTMKQKLTLMAEANQALYEAGLRRRFKISV